MKAVGCQPTEVPEFRMGATDVPKRLQVANLQGPQSLGWAPLMFYEGCRLPTCRGSRVHDGPHWCPTKAVGCQPTEAPNLGWTPLMFYEGCRLATCRGPRVHDGPHWCPIKAVGCQPTGVPEFWMGPAAPLMFYEAVGCQGCRLPTYGGFRVHNGPHWCPMKAVGCQPTGVPEFRMGPIECSMKAAGCQPTGVPEVRIGPTDVLWRL